MTLPCPECQAPMTLRSSRYGKFYGCSQYPRCKGTHGAHDDGRPLGIPANKETKQARMKAHAAFDRLWKSGKMKRGQAYKWMQDVMGMTRDEAHIGRFDKAQCDALVLRVEWEERVPSAASK